MKVLRTSPLRLTRNVDDLIPNRAEVWIMREIPTYLPITKPLTIVNDFSATFDSVGYHDTNIRIALQGPSASVVDA